MMSHEKAQTCLYRHLQLNSVVPKQTYTKTQEDRHVPTSPIVYKESSLQGISQVVHDSVDNDVPLLGYLRLTRWE